MAGTEPTRMCTDVLNPFAIPDTVGAAAARAASRATDETVSIPPR